MSKAKHRSFRKVLSIERSMISSCPVTLVTWCVVERETSRSIYTKHVAVTAYCGVKNQGVSARMPHKAERLDKKTLSVDERMKNEAATDAWLASMESKGRIGTVLWFGERGVGYVKDDATGQDFPIYACNVKGADNWHHELVKNVKLEKGERVTFDLGDKFTTKNCGAINVRKVA